MHIHDSHAIYNPWPSRQCTVHLPRTHCPWILRYGEVSN
ncbi:hypothetical protein PDIG_60980 [Penicillium digitatum PHI26]|uniref:Uncharacterized protein n=2 Tax=Penicillium digitatum TaxID=36651 RepID=K9FK34_PEND2|nr:hypothetical protein PDIP_70410 [Penicillium digitatum Pd1]EKV08078.1 hypothetical protein PDIP_70410 [Penicillium digitatum Pd1]EKV09619.1 hypothetical protein PDIG_60980 [Penicillium digitatum PHI26]